MLVTNKINPFSFLFEGRHVSDMPKADSLLKAQTAKVNDLTELEERIDIAKSENFYKVHNTCFNSPFAQLNRWDKNNQLVELKEIQNSNCFPSSTTIYLEKKR